MQYWASFAPNAKIATILPQFTPSRNTSSATCTNFVCAEPFRTFSLPHILARTTAWRSSSSSESFLKIAAVFVGGGFAFPMRYVTRSWAKLWASCLIRRISSLSESWCAILVFCKQLILSCTGRFNCILLCFFFTVHLNQTLSLVKTVRSFSLRMFLRIICLRGKPLNATCYVHWTGFPILTGSLHAINEYDWSVSVRCVNQFSCGQYSC